MFLLFLHSLEQDNALVRTNSVYTTQEFTFADRGFSKRTNEKFSFMNVMQVYYDAGLTHFLTGYDSRKSPTENLPLTLLTSGFHSVLGYGFYKCVKYAPRTSLFCSVLGTTFFLRYVKSFYESLIDHGNKVLACYNTTSGLQGYKFSELYPISSIPETVKIFGFSSHLLLLGHARERVKQCLERGIVVLAAGNDGVDLRQQKSLWTALLQYAQHPRCIVVSSPAIWCIGSRRMANFLSHGEVQSLGVNYIEVDPKFENCIGTSLAQPKVAAVLVRMMRIKQFDELATYVKILMNHVKGHYQLPENPKGMGALLEKVQGYQESENS